MKRPLYFLPFLWLGLRNLLSFILTLAFLACLIIAWQAPRLEHLLTSFIAKTPQQRADTVATLIDKSALVASASIDTFDVETNSQQRALLLNNVAINFVSGVDFACKSINISWDKKFKSLLFLFPQRINLDGMRLVTHFKNLQEIVSSSSTKARLRGRKETEWLSIARTVGFFAPVISERRIKLTNSIVALHRGRQAQPFLRLRFDDIGIESRNGLIWRGEGSVSGENGEKLLLRLRGTYTMLSGKLFQSLRVEDLSPQKAVSMLLMNTSKKNTPQITLKNSLFDRDFSQHEEVETWLARKGDLNVDYNHDFNGGKSWLKLRFGVSRQLPIFALDYSRDQGIWGFASSSVSFNDLPISFVWGKIGNLLPSHLVRDSLPFDLAARARGRLTVQHGTKLSTPRRLDGTITLTKPSIRWRGVTSPVNFHQLSLVLKGNDRALKIKTQLDLDDKALAGLDNQIELSLQPSRVLEADENLNERQKAESLADIPRMRIKLSGTSRGKIPLATVYGLWPPGFKKVTRSIVVDVVRDGQMKDFKILLDASFDLMKKEKKLGSLTGNFNIEDGRLRVFAEPLTATDVESVANFRKNSITFKIKKGSYGRNFAVTGGEVSFVRRKIFSGERHTLLNLSIDGEGQAESLRHLVQNAPFLQELTFLQQSARLIPPSPSARGSGHLNLRAFIGQLNSAPTETLFPEPLLYDTAWKFEKVKFLAPVLRFYQGSVDFVSTSSVPIDLSLELDSKRGLPLNLVWQNRLVTAAPDMIRNVSNPLRNVEQEVIKFNGILDSSALAKDLAYLPPAWLDEDTPIRLDYQKHPTSLSRGFFSLGEKPHHIRIESEALGSGQGVRISGGSSSNADGKAWRLDGTYKYDAVSSFLLRQQQIKKDKETNTESNDLLTILLQGTSGKVNEKMNTGVSSDYFSKPPHWRVLLSGQELDLASWVENKPWIALQQEDNNKGYNTPSLGLLSSVDLDLDVRLQRLRLHRQKNDSSRNGGNKIDPSSVPSIKLSKRKKIAASPVPDLPSSSDILKKVKGSLLWRDGILQRADFSSHGSIFALSSKNKKRNSKKAEASTVLQYDLRDGNELLSLESNDLGSFLHQSGGLDFAEGGRSQVTLIRAHKPNKRPKPHFVGNARIDNLALYELPTLFKIFDAIGIVTALRKGIRRLHVSSDIKLWNGVLSLNNFKLANNLTALTANGSVDIKNQKLDLQGEIASLPFVSNFLRKIPILGYIIVGRKKDNLFAFYYDAKGDWNNPKVTASPVNFLLPGIVKVANPLQLLERDEIKKAQKLERDKIEQQENK